MFNLTGVVQTWVTMIWSWQLFVVWITICRRVMLLSLPLSII